MSDSWGRGPHGKWGGRPNFEHGGPPWRAPRRFFAAVVFFLATMVAVPTAIGVYLGSRAPGGRPFFAIGVSLLVVALLGALFARVFGTTLRSTRQLVSATGRLADGDYSARVTGGARGSLSALIRSFNSMAERLESEDERRRQLLADLGHELRTPLTVLQARVEAMVDGIHPRDQPHIGALLTDIKTMERLLEDLRTLSLSQAGVLGLHREATDLDAMSLDLAETYRSDVSSIEVSVIGSIGTAVEVDPVRIRQVLTNLLNNAVAACDGNGTIEMRLSKSPTQLIVEIADDGQGIPASDLDHVFDRFHTGDTGTGSGIGLTLSRELVRAHGGDISIQSVERAGTTVRVELPIRGQAEAPE